MPEPQSSLPSFYSGFLKLFSGLALVQLFNFAFSLILPRFYAPADYALFGIFTSVVFILAELISLKLDMAVYLPEKDADAVDLMHAVFFVTLLLMLPVSGVAVAASFFYGPAFILLPGALLCFGFQQGLNAWFARTRDYRTLNRSRLIQALLTPLFSLLFIVSFGWSFGLVPGFLLGQLAGMAFLLFHFDGVQVRKLNFALLKKCIARHPQFPKYGVASSLVNSFSRNSILFFIERFFGVQQAGLYTMSSRLLSTPAGMYQSALSQVYVVQASALHGDALKRYTRETARFGFILGIVPALLLLFFGETIFAWLFGGQWAASGKMAQYLVFWLFTSAIINPVGMLVDIKQHLHFELRWNLALLALRMGAVLAGIGCDDLYLMLFLFSGISIGMNLYLYRYVLKLADDV